MASRLRRAVKKTQHPGRPPPVSGASTCRLPPPTNVWHLYACLALLLPQTVDVERRDGGVLPPRPVLTCLFVIVILGPELTASALPAAPACRGVGSPCFPSSPSTPPPPPPPPQPPPPPPPSATAAAA
ncbi:hypothetical protein C0Q70_01436 [Pomacea canaliculata]|uniref:Uncharacterized protein n=1 Tax=Pomacea canaliculata TaxID=400727 RepID=A0A2T7PZG2_POMCA|nr:hypothetical protein C0Q70_01436 [Pomacea canaliculata]